MQVERTVAMTRRAHLLDSVGFQVFVGSDIVIWIGRSICEITLEQSDSLEVWNLSTELKGQKRLISSC